MYYVKPLRWNTGVWSTDGHRVIAYTALALRRAVKNTVYDSTTFLLLFWLSNMFADVPCHATCHYCAPGMGVNYWYEHVCLYVCLSVCPFAYFKNHTSKLHEIFFTCYPGPWFGLHFTTVEHVTCFRFCAPHHVSHNRPERRDAASSHKFPTYSPGGATLFDFVIVNSGTGSKSCTDGVSDEDMTGAAAIDWWPVACNITKAGGEVWCLRLPCNGFNLTVHVVGMWKCVQYLPCIF